MHNAWTCVYYKLYIAISIFIVIMNLCMGLYVICDYVCTCM
jgi:hypothetical protein